MKSKNVTDFLMQRGIGFCNSFSTNERVMTSFAEEKAARWDVEEQSYQLPNTTRSTFLMAFSHDGTKVASAHGDHKIYICDVRTRRCLHILEGHPRTPWCIAFHPSFCDILASGCLGGQVRVWDLHGGCEIWTEKSSNTIASLDFHPVDQVLIIATKNRINFWDWSQPEPFTKCKTLSEHERVRFVRFDRYGHRLITGISNNPKEDQNVQKNTLLVHCDEQNVSVQNYLSTLREKHRQLLHCLQNLHSTVQEFSNRQSTRTMDNETAGQAEHLEGSSLEENLEESVNLRSYSSSFIYSIAEHLLLEELRSLQIWYNQECQRFRELLLAGSNLQNSSSDNSINNNNSSTNSNENGLNTVHTVRSNPDQNIIRQTKLSIQNARNIMTAIFLVNRLQETCRNRVILEMCISLEKDLSGLLHHICSMMSKLSSHNSGNHDVLRRVALRLVNVCQRHLVRNSFFDRGSSSRNFTSDYFVNEIGSRIQDRVNHLSDLPGPSGIQRILSQTVPLSSRFAFRQNSFHSIGQLSRRQFHLNRSVSNNENENSLQGAGSSSPDLIRGLEPSTHSAFRATPSSSQVNTNNHNTARLDSFLDELSSLFNLNNQEQVISILFSADKILKALLENLEGLLQHLSTINAAVPRSSASDSSYLTFRQEQQDSRYHILLDRLHEIHAGTSSEPYTLPRVTYRIQCWDFKDCVIPDISDCYKNVVVRECLIQNDACVDISTDGSLLVAFIPGSVSTVTLLGIHSLEPDTFGQCLYLWNFHSSVTSVSFSPLGNYILVGMGSVRRLLAERNGKLIIGEILQIKRKGFQEGYLQLVRTIEASVENQNDTSLNSTRWLPIPGQGFMYGTNRGELKICRPRAPFQTLENNSSLKPSVLSFYNANSESVEVQTVNVVHVASQETQSRSTQTDM